jgi:hypothetical protein
VKYQTVRQTISYAPDFTVVNYRQKLPANLAQISATEGKRIHHTQYTYAVHTFSWPLLSFVPESLGPVAPIQEKPHTTPYLSLIYISTYHCIIPVIPGLPLVLVEAGGVLPFQPPLHHPTTDLE